MTQPAVIGCFPLPAKGSRCTDVVGCFSASCPMTKPPNHAASPACDSVWCQHGIGRPETSPIQVFAIYPDAYPLGRWPPWSPRHRLNLHALLRPEKTDLKVLHGLAPWTDNTRNKVLAGSRTALRPRHGRAPDPNQTFKLRTVLAPYKSNTLKMPEVITIINNSGKVISTVSRVLPAL